MISEELRKILKDSGRELAVTLLEGAVTSAENSEQMNNQIRVLNAASVHILATQVFNVVKQDRASKQTALDMIFKQVTDEYTLLGEVEGEMVLAKIKGPKQ